MAKKDALFDDLTVETIRAMGGRFTEKLNIGSMA